MVLSKNQKHTASFQQKNLFKKTLLAACIMAAGSSAYAQDAGTDDALVEEVLVTGTRASLQNAQEIKRNSDTHVDAISASDIGALPDKSVLESLQRVPGVAVERYSAATDPDHFSIEGSGITLRGLPQTRSEFNGRDAFTANSGRGLSFQDVPPELMSKVEVFKNSTADLIEGGISGTVNLNTRKPFDSGDQVIAFSLAQNYGDLAQEWTPSYSGLFSDRWETGAGEFGFLVSLAKSELTSRTDGLAYGQVANNANNDSDVPPSEKLQRNAQGIYQLINTAVRTATQNRNRDGGSLVLQWRDPSETVLSTFEYVRSEAGRNWMEHNMEADDKTGPATILGANSDYVTTGRIQGIDSMTATTRFQDHTSLVEDYSLNFVITPSDELTLKADLQFVDAKTDETDLSFQAGVRADTEFSFKGERPDVVIVAPDGTPGSADYFSADRSRRYFTNPANYFWRSSMDHLEDSSGDEKAIKLDAEYQLDAGWFKSVETGVRFADREQNTQWSKYNWGNLSENWNGGRKYFNGIIDNTPWDGVQNGVPYDAPYSDANGAARPAQFVPPYEAFTYDDNYFRGGNRGVLGETILVPSETLVRDYAKFIQASEAFPNRQTAGSRVGVIPGTVFLPNELNDVREINKAIYAKLNFGNESESLTGNIGLRYVHIDTETTGGISYANAFDASLTQIVQDFYINPDDHDNDPNTAPIPRSAESIQFGQDQIAWHTGGSGPRNTVENTIKEALPSFNIKWSFTDDMVARFGASKAISFPDLGNMRNFVAMYSVPTITRAGGSSTGKVTNISWEYKGGAGNPELEPMESINLDLSAEWYFAKDGSIFVGVFHKDLTNFFAGEAVSTAITNNGATRVVEIDKPINTGDSKILGFEMGYQQFYDMLPAPFDGLGLQVNFTLLDQSGDVPNSGLDSSTPVQVSDPNSPSNTIPPRFTDLPLQGMSDETFNIVTMYEKDDLSVRLAYNWRSEYLLTARDVITNAPIFAQDSGQVDGSIYYNLNDNLKIGLEGSNLLDEVNWTKMQVDQEGTKVPRNYFINDRRYSIVLRGTF
jgi:iron complex outermembrane recepter protein